VTERKPYPSDLTEWDYLPHDLPPKSATYYYFGKWRDDGTDKTIHDLLRWHLREKKKRSDSVFWELMKAATLIGPSPL
jgi:transposase